MFLLFLTMDLCILMWRIRAPTHSLRKCNQNKHLPLGTLSLIQNIKWIIFMSAKSINGHSYASVFFDFAIGTNGLRCLPRHWPLSVFLCSWEKMSLLRKIQTAGRPSCEVRPLGGQPQPSFSSKMQTGAPCKAQPSGGDTAGATFSTVFCFLGMPPLPQRSLLSHLQQALTFLVPWPPTKEINASHFLSHWENCLTICRGENRILYRKMGS